MRKTHEMLGRVGWMIRLAIIKMEGQLLISNQLCHYGYIAEHKFLNVENYDKSISLKYNLK